MDRKNQLIEVFEDTQKLYTENKILAEATNASKKATRLYEANDYPILPIDDENHLGKVTVTKSKTFQAAMLLHKRYPTKK